MNKYEEYRINTARKVNSFPMIFAFSREQLKEGLEKLNTTKDDLISVGGGCFIRKSDKEDFIKLSDSLDKELEDLLMKDDSFVYDMFLYEMGNHEYCLTYDDKEVLDACGIDFLRFNKDVRLKNIYLKAKQDYLYEECC